MWQLSLMDLLIALGMATVLGFGIGVAWWEWIKPERIVYDAGNSSDIVDLPVPSSSGGLSGDLGIRRVGNSSPSPSNENNLDNNRLGRDLTAG